MYLLYYYKIFNYYYNTTYFFDFIILLEYEGNLILTLSQVLQDIINTS